MGITLGSNFDVETALPLDSRLTVADNTARDAIDSLKRYEGMVVYVEAEEKSFQLVAGITNGDWVEFGAGGGGGGIDVEWFQDAYGPLQSVVDNSQVYEFEDATFHYLYADLRLPDSYSAGDPVNLKVQFYTSVTSGDVLFQTISTLVRDGSDAADSTTNQRTSTNTAITVNATANVVTTATIDLSSTTGEINAVALSPGDRIKVRLTRATGTDTAAASVFLYKKGSEVTLK